MLARLWTVLDPTVDALPAAEVLERVLDRLREHFGVTAAALASAALARLERAGDGFRVVLASAGHPPALEVRADGTVDDCHVAGALLGITEAPEMADAETLLGPGDALVLYTDGLIEARSPEGLLGEARVREALARGAGASADAVATRLDDLAAAFSRLRRRDDLALLVARVIP